MGLIQDTCGGRFDKDEVAKISFAYDAREISSPSFSRAAQRFSTPSYSHSIHLGERDSHDSRSGSPHPFSTHRNILTSVLSNVLPFSELTGKDLDYVIRKYFEEVRFDKDQVVVQPGENWDHYYVVLEGRLRFIPHTYRSTTRTWEANLKAATPIVPITLASGSTEQEKQLNNFYTLNKNGQPDTTLGKDSTITTEGQREQGNNSHKHVRTHSGNGQGGSSSIEIRNGSETNATSTRTLTNNDSDMYPEFSNSATSSSASQKYNSSVFATADRHAGGSNENGDTLQWSFGDAAIWGRSKQSDEKIVTTTKCIVVRMKADIYRGLYNKHLDDKLVKPIEKEKIKKKEELVQRLYTKKNTDCFKLLHLLQSKETRNNFAFHCELIELDGTDEKNRHVSRKDTDGPIGTNFYMVVEGTLLSGPKKNESTEEKEIDAKEVIENKKMPNGQVASSSFTANIIIGGSTNVEKSISNNADNNNNDNNSDTNAFKEYISGQFLEEKSNDDLMAKSCCKKCSLLKLTSTQIRLFFATRTCRDAIRVFEGAKDLEERLKYITCLRTSKSKQRALQSCTHETMSSASAVGVDIGIHMFTRGEYLLRAGRVASRAIDMRTRQCDSFILKTGSVIITDPTDSLSTDPTNLDTITTDVNSNAIVAPGYDGYVTAYQDDLYDSKDPRLRCVNRDVRALEDTTVYVVRLHHDKETLGKRFAAFGEAWCCASSDARSGKGTTRDQTKPMRQSSLGTKSSSSNNSYKDEKRKDDDDNSNAYGSKTSAATNNNPMHAENEDVNSKRVRSASLGLEINEEVNVVAIEPTEDFSESQKETFSKYRQVQNAWNTMHPTNVPSSDTNASTTSILDASIPSNIFEGFNMGPIGKGMVGNVFHLTRGESSENRHHYAAKSMRKQDISAKTNGAQNVLDEIEAMKLMEHPFIIQLYCTWQTSTDLVILLDYMPGGELFMVIRNRSSGMFPHLEPYSVRFYAACVLSALTYMHDELGYVYRDLKGENVLIDHQGYAKLCDFGFAKKLRTNDKTWSRTKTVCGTPDYMAPEIIGGHSKYRGRSEFSKQGGYGPSVDFWSLGVLIYEMLYKYSPFTDKGRHKKYPQIFHNVMNPNYHVARPDGNLRDVPPSELNGRMSRLEQYDPDCYDIIKCLLCRNPSRRLGYSRVLGNITIGGGRNVMCHTFFSGGVGDHAHLFPAIDFLLLERRQLEPPWVPEFSDDKPTEHMRTKVRTKEVGKVMNHIDMIPDSVKDPKKRESMLSQFEHWSVMHDAVRNVPQAKNETV